MSDAIADDAVSQTPLQKVWGEIEEHGLERYVAEMDANGYTVIPPELASPNGLCERLLDAVMDVAENATAYARILKQDRPTRTSRVDSKR